MTGPERHSTGSRVAVEVHALGLTEHGELGALVQWHAAPREDPVEVARAALVEPGRELHLLHSTSWRWGADDDAVVLTFMAVSTPLPDTGLVMPRFGGQPGDALIPAPTEPTLGAVLAHGLGHLSFLARKPGSPTRSVLAELGLLAAVVDWAPTVAGRFLGGDHAQP